MKRPLLGLLFALGLGCSGSDEPGIAYARTRAGDMVGGCSTSGLVCDIRERACQERVYGATQCVSELAVDLPLPPIRTIDVEQLMNELQERLAMREPDPIEARWTAALQQLGLLPAGLSAEDAAVDVTVSNVAAYYDTETEDITVIDRGDSADPNEDLLVLSHEMAHALRDAESDLDALQDRVQSTDEHLALSTLVEGEAMVIALDVFARSVSRSSSALDWQSGADNVLDVLFQSLPDSGSVLFTLVQGLPYSIGTGSLGPQWEDEGRAATDPQFDAPERSLLPWIDRAASPEPLDCYPTAPPPDYVADDQDTLGVSGVVSLPLELDRDSDPYQAYDLGARWRGDRLVIFRPADDEVSTNAVAAWRVRFAGAEDAVSFADRIEPSLPSTARLVVDGVEVLLLATADAARLEGWTEAESCGRAEDLPPPRSSLGAMMHDDRGLRAQLRGALGTPADLR